MLLTVTKLNYNSFVYSIATINAFIDHVIAHGAEISQILQTHRKVSNRGWSVADQSSLTIAPRSNKNTGLSNPLNSYLFMVLLCPSTQSSHISKQQSDLCSNGFFVVFICKIYRFISSYGLFNSVYSSQSIQLLPVKFYDLYLEYIILVYCLKYIVIQLNQPQSIAIITLMCMQWSLIGKELTSDNQFNKYFQTWKN